MKLERYLYEGMGEVEVIYIEDVVYADSMT